MAGFAFDHMDHAFEGIYPESSGAENAQFNYYPSWDSLDPNHEATRYDQHHYGFNFGHSGYSQRRYFSSYDGVAHGFGLEGTIKQTETQLYQLGLDTQWHADHDRHIRYISPTSSGASLSSSNSSMSDYTLSPDASKDAPFFAPSHNIYPSPTSEPYRERTSAVYHQPPNDVFAFATPIVPSQSALSMKDLQFSPDAQAEDNFVEDADTITATAHALEILELSEHPSPEDQDLSHGRETESEEDHAMRDESDNDSEFRPNSTIRRPAVAPLRSSQRAHRRTIITSHVVQDPEARIHKPAAKTKTKPKLGRKPSTSVNSTTTIRSKLFPCPFSAFGCAAVFPSKNEWKRHTGSQHLQLGFYRCDLGTCSPEHPSQLTQTRGHNDFNRKDLFTQHCRRMHWDECEGLNGSKVKGKDWAQWSMKEKQKFEEYMEDVRDRCWTERRKAPSNTNCAVCAKVFDDELNDEEGKAWEERMEHVGRHYERGERDNEGRVDEGLQDWCAENGIVVWVEGKYWLKGCEPQESKHKPGKTGTRRSLRREENGHYEQENGLKAHKEGAKPADEDTDAEGEVE